MAKRDIDYIEEKFRCDGIEAPEALSEAAMLEMLQAARPEAAAAGATPKPAPAGPADNADPAEQSCPEAGRPPAAAADKADSTNKAGSTNKADSADNAGPAFSAGAVPTKRKSFVQRHRGLAALAACLILALVTAPLWTEARQNFWYGSDVYNGEEGATLVACNSYDDIQAQLKKIEENERLSMKMRGQSLLMRDTVNEDMAMSDSTDAETVYDAEAPQSNAKGIAGAGNQSNAKGIAGDGTLSSKTASADGSNHSNTYVQVEGVDEADIIKTDGRYIYHITSDGNICISRPEGKKAKGIAIIKADRPEELFQDLYLTEGRLIAIGSSYQQTNRAGSIYGNDLSTVTIYDIEDPEHPEKLQQFEQSGSMISSRMADGYVYLVTNCYAGGEEDFVPAAGGNGKLKKLEAGEIYLLPNPKSRTYAVLSAIDISAGTQVQARTKAVLGASEHIYCNGENMYIAGPEWDGMVGGYWYPGYRPEYTRILKASLKDGKVKFLHSVRVRGSLNDQFSMDEKDGYLRVATTSNQDGKDQNNLYVLDKALKKAGSVTGFAEDEHIEAVRFLGDRGYVITYEQTDPLFVLDLSDPRHPKIDGSVKISGFSTLLVPVNDKTLLGIGYCTETTELGEALDGTKLVLFDISDPSRPKVIDSKEFPGMNSPAQYEHKALLVGPEARWYAIPYDIWNEAEVEDAASSDDVVSDDAGVEDTASSDDEARDDAASDAAAEEEPYYNEYHEGGVLTFSAGNKLTDVESHALSQEGMQRVIYIDGYIYALDDADHVTGMRF